MISDKNREMHQWGTTDTGAVAWNVAVLLLLSFLVTDAPSQQPKFRTQSNVVTVPTLALDQNGEPVFGLQASDFIIEDDGKSEKASLDDSLDSPPLSIVIALQVGRSAKAEFPRIAEFQTMLEPIMTHGTARVALLTFDSQVRQVSTRRRTQSNGPLQISGRKPQQISTAGAQRKILRWAQIWAHWN